MKAILCEKPSQAEQIAAGLAQIERKKPKREGTSIVVGDWRLFWAQGHLLQVDTKKTKTETKDFPYFPRKFYYTPTGAYARKLLKNMAPHLKKATDIVVATDFGREGELIARLILNWVRPNPRARYWRMWTSAALSPKVVKEAIENLKPLKEFDLLYEEAKARQASDWIVGINLSIELMRLVGDGQSWSIGRVQTPTLAITVLREWQIENFKPQPYSLVFARLRAGENEIRAKYVPDRKREEADSENSEEEISLFETASEKEKKKYGLTREQVEEIFQALEGVKSLKVEKVIEKRKKVSPPLLHTLTTLQTKINRSRKIPIAKVAQAAQSLYEKELISYPRTESQYLSTSNIEDVKEILSFLGRRDLTPKANKSNRIFNDKKVTDHHGLIPQIPQKKVDLSKLSDVEKAVYEEIKNTFLAQFEKDAYDAEVKLTLSTRVGSKDYTFVWSDRAVIEPGWRKLFGRSQTGELISYRFREGEELPLLKLEEEKKTTKPPKRFDEGSLVHVMKNAHLLIPPEQKALRKIMKEKDNPGLGTAATRTGIIQNLVSKGYLVRKKNELVPTEKAKELIRRLYKRSVVADPIMTAQFEQKLAQISRGELSRSRFLKEVEELVLSEIERFEKEFKFSELSNLSAFTCPFCSSEGRFDRVGANCPNCGRIAFRKFLSKKLSDDELKRLLEKKTVELSGLKSKNGKSFSAVVEYDFDERRIRIKEFINRPKRNFGRQKRKK